MKLIKGYLTVLIINQNQSNMKIISKFLMLAFLLPAFAYAQDEEEEPKRNHVELNYMRAKIGHEKAFVDAVKDHNEKFHKDGSPHEAGLSYIRMGEKAGWYTWVMGGFDWADLDNAPDSDEHAKDWSNNVAPHVNWYGPVEVWVHSDKYSVDQEGENKVELIMWLRVKRGNGHRMRDFMKKVNAVQKENGGEMHYYYTSLYSDDEPNVALVFPSDNWTDFGTPAYNMKEKYDEMHGEGSWTNALRDWNDFVEWQAESIMVDVD